MRFHITSSGPDQRYEGTATNHRRDPARAFCDAYRRVAADFLDTSSLRLEPAFWGGAHVPDEDQEPVPMRCFYTEEDEPGIFSAVFTCLGYEATTFDVIVMMPDRMAAYSADRDSILPIVIQDAASVLTDEDLPPEALSWAAADIKRAAVAAVLTRAAEPLFSSSEAIAQAYDQVCASAMNGLINYRYGLSPNGYALLVRQNPGVVTLIDKVARLARSAPPLPLLLDAMLAADAAERNLAHGIACLGQNLKLVGMERD